jgi:hypothetical protein
MRTLYILLFSLLSLLSGSAQTDESLLEQALFNLPDVTFKKTSKPGEPILQYALTIRQPLDHQHPEKGSFGQQVLLTHKGFESPTVMNINGYALYKARNELVRMLHANELNIEYRFYGQSAPDSLPWEYLTYEQVAADLHRINRLFKELYTGKWFSTGISRGGQTAIIYKYYYPEDVEVSVPYVAPIIDGLEDKRIYDFLDTIGTDECHNRIFDFQVYLLKHEKEVLDRLQWYARGRRLEFGYLGSIGKAFEYTVLEYPFSFWQVGYKSCSDIPLGKSTDEYVSHLLDIIDLESFADKELQDNRVHFYQSVTEGGYYGYDARPFRKYLHYIDTDNPSGSFPPKSLTYRSFDSSLMDRISSWLAEHGDNFIYIYGDRDTWSACRVNVTEKVNSRLYMVPGANHFAARVRNMPADMQRDFADTFLKMSGIPVELEVLK